jgi:beta-lactamase regulating signal transducer with metallopeptidase domain/TolA-binding protein
VDTLLEIGLGNAVMAAVLALLAALATRFCRKPALTHALWVLVLLKLITPPIRTVPLKGLLASRTPPTPITRVAVPPAAILPEVRHAPPPLAPAIEPWMFGAMAGAVATEPDEPPALATESPRPVVIDLPEPIRRTLNLDARAAETAATEEAVPEVPRPSLVEKLRDRLPPTGTMLLRLSLLGSAVCALVVLVRITRFHRLLRFATPTPDAVVNRVESLARRMGVACPSVWFVPGALCPMVFATGGRPRLLIPSELWDQFSAVQQSAMLVHELAHLRRGDHRVRWLEIAATVLYWWHPVVWWARRELREAEEQCCDAWVVSILPGSGRQYATALLDALEFLSAPAGDETAEQTCAAAERRERERRSRSSVPAWASGMGEFYRLKRRLVMIKTANVARQMTRTGIASVLGLAGLLLPVAPGWAQQETKEKDQPAVLATPRVETKIDVKTEVTKERPDKINVEDEKQVILGLRSDPKDKHNLELFGVEEKPLAPEKLPDLQVLSVDQASPDNVQQRNQALDALKRQNAEQQRQNAEQQRQNAEQQRQLERARAEVQKLSQALGDATRRLAQLEAQTATQNKMMADRAAAMAKANPAAYGQALANQNAQTWAVQPGAKGFPDGAYKVVQKDGQMTVYSGDGKVISVTRGGPTAGIAPPTGAVAIAPGAPMSQPPAGLPYAKPEATQVAPVPPAPGGPMMGAWGYAAQPGNRGQTELEKRLDKLEGKLQALTQELQQMRGQMHQGGGQPMLPPQPQPPQPQGQGGFFPTTPQAK